MSDFTTSGRSSPVVTWIRIGASRSVRHTSRAARARKRRTYLLNPLSSEKWELGDVSDEALSETVRALRELRLMRSVRCDDDEFVETSLSLGLGRYEALEGLVSKLGARRA